MNLAHKDLAGGRWFEFSLLEQMANIGSEVERAMELFNLTLINKRQNSGANTSCCHLLHI